MKPAPLDNTMAGSLHEKGGECKMIYKPPPPKVLRNIEDSVSGGQRVKSYAVTTTLATCSCGFQFASIGSGRLHQ